MKIAMFGGSFNPPHMGHVEAARSVIASIHPDRLLIMPTCVSPHKAMAGDTPPPEKRLELCRLAFAGLPEAEVSDLEMRRAGKSYTVDTLQQLKELYPDAELTLVMGTDMILSLESWKDPETIMQLAQIAVLLREDGEKDAVLKQIDHLQTVYDAKVQLLEAAVYPATSTEIRAELKQAEKPAELGEEEYAYIVKHLLYGARAELCSLREKGLAMLKPNRVKHVLGVEQEAVKLAKRWGEDEYMAAAAGILHDCTKKLTTDEQLNLCKKYGIILDTFEEGFEKALHQMTGAAVAEHEFGACKAICEAIRWHTTAKPEMTTLEKVVYLADYIEPNRDFEGVDRMRVISYQDLDLAMEEGLRMTMEDLRSKHAHVLEESQRAYDWFKSRREGLY